MSDAEESYFVRWRGKVTGPLVLDRLKELVAQGRLSRLHQISTDQATWRQADTFTELYPPYERKRVPMAEAVAENGAESAAPSAEAQPAEWYYSVGGKVEGPRPTSAVKQLIAEGKLSKSDYVSRLESPEEWRLILEVPEFKEILGTDVEHARHYPDGASVSGVEHQEVYAERSTKPGGGHGLAVASMVLGLVGICFWPLGILAIIFGGVAKARMSRAGERSGSAMATTGIVLGIIEVALGALGVLWILGLTAFVQQIPVGGY